MNNIVGVRLRLHIFFLVLLQAVGSFQWHASQFHTRRVGRTVEGSIVLSAKKSKKKKTTQSRAATVGKRTRSASGFGGAATEICPCGSKYGYMKCCGKIIHDPIAYAKASASSVVLARYSAYAKREVDFIVGSTHPLNKDFMSDIDHWKKTIRNNCYDNFELTKCDIINESYEGEETNEIALVKFVAKLVQVDSREKTSFMETSTFERAGKSIRNGAWLYKSGIIESAEEGMEIVEEDLSLSAKVN